MLHTSPVETRFVEKVNESAAGASSRYVGAPGRLIVWRSFKPIFFKIFLPRTRPAKVLMARAQIAANFTL
jgi:hypothetical protein